MNPIPIHVDDEGRAVFEVTSSEHDWLPLTEDELRQALFRLAEHRRSQNPECASTDDAPPAQVLAEVRRCAISWEPEVRLVGNVRAGDIVRAIDSLALQAESPPDDGD